MAARPRAQSRTQYQQRDPRSVIEARLPSWLVAACVVLFAVALILLSMRLPQDTMPRHGHGPPDAAAPIS